MTDTRNGCGFSSWGAALRHWRSMLAVLAGLLIFILTACLPGLPRVTNTRTVAEATPTPSGAEFYRGVYAMCHDAMIVYGSGDTAAANLCNNSARAHATEQWHATEWPGYEP